MTDTTKCYEILGVRAGISREELKTAHRDLAKVWHPDRFAHDPRLQAKAQEKLKEINDAFDQLTSAKAKRRPPPQNNGGSESYHQSRETRHSRTVAASQPTNWRLVFAAVLVFGVAFFFTSRSLIRRNWQQSQDPASSSTEQIPALQIDDGKHSNSRAEAGGDELSRGKNRTDAQSASEGSVARQTIGTDAWAVQPMATVTVTIDQATGMLARRNCPTKSTMTYVRGNEPHQYCNVHLPLEPAQPESERSKESRIKSAAKRLVSPDKW